MLIPTNNIAPIEAATTNRFKILAFTAHLLYTQSLVGM